MSNAAEVAQLRAELDIKQAERARLRAAYEAIGAGSLDPAFGAATYRHAVADLQCAQIEDEIERRRQMAERRGAA